MATFEQPEIAVKPADDVAGPKQGQWTYEHYTALPDDGQRYEIVDGVLYMPPPSPNDFHQGASNLFATYLTIHVQFKGLGRVYTGPFDVRLTFNTVVQPDVIVILAENLHKITRQGIVGSPDLAIEIASPSTKRYDRLVKWNAYARAGVQEYWIAEPLAQTVEVLVLEGDSYTSLGVFGGEDILPSRVVPDFPVRVKQFFA
jgi:Uma2 family endonuclease